MSAVFQLPWADVLALHLPHLHVCPSYKDPPHLHVHPCRGGGEWGVGGEGTLVGLKTWGRMKL